MEVLPLPSTVCHPFHQKHELRLVTTRPSGFLCNGCKQFGQEPEHYRCEACDLNLHARCGAAPAAFVHSLFDGSRFTLLVNHTTQNGEMFCRACGGESVGLRYHNLDLNFYLHPCCAFLPQHVVQDGHTFELRNDALEVRSLAASRKCRMCKERLKTQSLSYRGGGHLYLHVPCLVKAYNAQTGQKNWQASTPIMEGVLRAFTRKRDAAKAILGAGKIAVGVTTIVSGVLALSEGAGD